MTRSNAIPTVLFIAIAISVGLNPPEANEVVPNSSVQQTSNSSTDSGITDLDSNTVVNSTTIFAPMTSHGKFVGLSAPTENEMSSELVSVPHLVPQTIFGAENAISAELLPTRTSTSGVVTSGDFTLTTIYGVGGNVIAQP
ncbi:hypothetical protein [Alteromonas sp. KUL49]|uniref:hypothetical protein n=1 Tax=Alteromonas sp. KUL49 TaxID=2480798 RepID=UPI00102EE17A|nr:hypothetical protein [Alteromonas sp. KUL49]TAP42359.1 hypothetical protein EYS00_01720 [Alteromonas sp. KUL49]